MANKFLTLNPHFSRPEDLVFIGDLLNYAKYERAWVDYDRPPSRFYKERADKILNKHKTKEKPTVEELLIEMHEDIKYIRLCLQKGKSINKAIKWQNAT